MNYLLPEWMYRADSVDLNTITDFGKKFTLLIDDPKRSDPRKYLKDEMDSDVDTFYEQSA